MYSKTTSSLVTLTALTTLNPIVINIYCSNDTEQILGNS